jgi:hypothetical protein
MVRQARPYRELRRQARRAERLDGIGTLFILGGIVLVVVVLTFMFPAP